MDIKNLRIGPSGNDADFYNAGFKRGFESPSFVRSLGLNAFEYSFGRGFNASLETCAVIGHHARMNDVLYSVHAPFYINFANENDEMIEKSIQYVIKSIEYLYAFGGKKVVFHPASQGKLSRPDALEIARSNIKKLVDRIYSLGYDDVFICPETMGKSMQIGSYFEKCDLCSIDKILVPCFDFGHINALSHGGLVTLSDFKNVFAYSKSVLGDEKTNNCHIHFSKIQYGDKGEIRHLDFDDTVFGPDFRLLAKAIKDCKITPSIICESSTKMSADACVMKNILENV